MGLTSSLASARYRALIPAQQLSRRGHDVQVRSVAKGEWSRDIVDFPCDVLVVSKSLERGNERHVREMKARGVKVIVDICDNVFADPKYGEHFRALAALGDLLTSSSEAMAAAIRNETGRESLVISDPAEGRRGIARFAPALPAIKMLWFGNPRSMEGVSEHVEELAEFCDMIPVRLSIVTLPWPQLRKVAAQLGTMNPTRLIVKFVPWSLEATWRALEECDLVWLPAASGDFHRTKSSNRLVESLWAGRAAAADAIESYEPFRAFTPIGKRLGEAVLESIADTAAAEARIAGAQRQLARTHSPFACGLAWAGALGDDFRTPVRLNLGCGSGILDGYVNVDDGSHAGARLDVVCDLRDLDPFDDHFAEEILARHVLERFWKGEVPPMLREWMRVLRPGGRLIVECANLIGAARTLLDTRMDDAEGALQIFYGYRDGEDMPAVHRWGYTPQSLEVLFTQVGLVNIRREPADFAGAEEGGVRIVGNKP